MEEERTKHYNPADYAAVKEKAKSMDKKELEDYYVKEKDRSYVPTWLGIIFFILGILIIFVFVMIGTLIVVDNVNEDLSYNVRELEKEVCPRLNTDLVDAYEFTIQEAGSFLDLHEVILDCKE